METKESLHAKLNRAKTEAEKLEILQATVVEQKKLVAKEKKEMQVKETTQQRKARNRNIYSLGTAVVSVHKFLGNPKLNEAKVQSCNAALLTFIDFCLNESSPIAARLNGATVLQPKDFIRLVDSLRDFGIKYNPNHDASYEKYRAQQKERAAAMRKAREEKRAQAIANQTT